MTTPIDTRLYQKMELATATPLGPPTTLPADIAGLDDWSLADLANHGPQPCLPEYVGIGFFAAIDNTAGLYVNKERFGDLLQPAVRKAILNLQKLAATIVLPIGQAPTAEQAGLLDFEDGAETFARADQINLRDPRLPIYLRGAAQLHAFDGYDVEQEIARIQNNLTP